jgi:hypothetical protein
MLFHLVSPTQQSVLRFAYQTHRLLVPGEKIEMINSCLEQTDVLLRIDLPAFAPMSSESPSIPSA